MKKTLVKSHIREIEYIKKEYEVKNEFDVISKFVKITKKKKNLFENGKVFNWENLEEKFGVERLENIANFKDKEYEIEYMVCPELEGLFKEIDKIKKTQFATENEIILPIIGSVLIGKKDTFRSENNPFGSGKKYENKFYFIKWNDILAEHESTDNIDGLLVEFKEKIRRYFEYNSPYRKPENWYV